MHPTCDTMDNIALIQRPPSISYDDKIQAQESSYHRNTVANDDPRELKKSIIAEPRVGLSFVQLLQQAAEKKNKKTVDVTGKRRERKSVLPAQVWARAKEELMSQGIFLIDREKKGPEAATATDRCKATLTYYGTSAVFYNHQVKTKIRMRIRYYLSYERNAAGDIEDVQREGVTKENGYLELKVKSPRAFEENSVDKYRVLVSDPLIAKLVNLDPTNSSFLEDVQSLSLAVQEENPDKEELVETIFAIMASLAKRKPAFIKPSLVITYERSAYKYIEHDYSVPMKPSSNDQPCPGSYRQRKKCRLLNWLHRGRRSSSPRIPLEKMESTEPASDTTESQDAMPVKPDLKLSQGQRDHKGCWITRSDEEEVPSIANHQTTELHDIEYQFTVDKHVRAHYPLLPDVGATEMPVVGHFYAWNKTEMMRYPSDARVVEFKEPLIIAILSRKDRSATHSNLIRYLVDRMQAEIMWGDYDECVGKYGNFRRRLTEEKSTDLIKNKMIEIDLTGSAMYLNVTD